MDHLKIGNWYYIELKNLCIKENNQQGEKATYGMGANNCKSYI